jgi:lipopolysaccharide/colanic/teichoic acid biosynthesis glycosyltransferase
MRRTVQVANLRLIHLRKHTMAFQHTAISSESEERVPHPSKRLVLSPGWQSPLHLAVKRAIDVTVSAALLFLLAPLFLLTAIAVKLSSAGPVFYQWKVVGRGGQRFTGYKFRSMVANADALRDELASRNEMKGPVFKIAQDPRITKVGTCLRKYSLDELPQLYNVLTGAMSLVGPRPPLASEYEQFTEYQKQKVQVKPGITCLWQVSGRNRISDFDEWVKLDLEYIRRWSLSLDLKILMRTVGTVLSGSGK